jgi:hypothetical protein
VAAQQVADAAVGEFTREQGAVAAMVDQNKQRSDDKIAVQRDIRQIRPGTPDGFDAIRRLRTIINGIKTEKVKTQAEKLVVAVETAFSGVSAIVDQPGVQKALSSAATSITPAQKRIATSAKRKTEEQQKGQDLNDADIRRTLKLSASAPLTRAKWAYYTKFKAENIKNQEESRPGTAVSLSDIVISLDDAIDDTETFFQQQPELAASEQELRDLDNLDQISTKSFDYMQVFVNAAAQLPVAAPPPQPPGSSYPASSTAKPSDDPTFFRQESRIGQPNGIRKALSKKPRGRGRRTPKKKSRKSTFRRHRKH